MSTEPEYTPTTDILRDLWVDHLLDPLPRSEGIALVPAVQAAFDRWLAARDAEQRREVIRSLIASAKRGEWVNPMDLAGFITEEARQ